MSAALKSAKGSSSFGLRRTASLEEFLDKDKEEVSIELNQPPTIYKRKTSEESTRPSRKSGKLFFPVIFPHTLLRFSSIIGLKKPKTQIKKKDEASISHSFRKRDSNQYFAGF